MSEWKRDKRRETKRGGIVIFWPGVPVNPSRWSAKSQFHCHSHHRRKANLTVIPQQHRFDPSPSSARRVGAARSGKNPYDTYDPTEAALSLLKPLKSDAGKEPTPSQRLTTDGNACMYTRRSRGLICPESLHQRQFTEPEPSSACLPNIQFSASKIASLEPTSVVYQPAFFLVSSFLEWPPSSLSLRSSKPACLNPQSNHFHLLFFFKATHICL